MARTTRREFLHESILAATAAALAAPIPAGASSGESNSPAERLHIAVIGAGSRGPAPARAFATW